MKKLATIILTLALTLTLAGCGIIGSEPNGSSTQPPSTDNGGRDDSIPSGDTPVNGEELQTETQQNLYVVTAGRDNEYDMLADIADWQDIIQVSLSRVNAVGLKSDGTVVIVGSVAELSDIRDAVNDWNDIIKVPTYLLD